MCRIDWWGEDAFVIPDGTQPGHPFNPNVVGPIHRLTNKAIYQDLADPRVFVDVWPVVNTRVLPILPAGAAQPHANPPPPPPPWRRRSVHKPVRCLVDTGAKESVFGSEVAKLNFRKFQAA